MRISCARARSRAGVIAARPIVHQLTRLFPDLLGVYLTS
jgi:hypothetical protein